MHVGLYVYPEFQVADMVMTEAWLWSCMILQQLVVVHYLCTFNVHK